jgi:hypothetical protein
MSESSLSEQVIQLIGDEVKSRFATTGKWTHGAQLADAIRDRFPGIGWEALGFSKLADAVHKAEELGLVVRDRNVRHLQVGPVGQLGAETPSPSPSSVKAEYVRPDIWRATVFASNPQIAYLHRHTGDLISLRPGEEGRIAELSGSSDHVRLGQINGDTQRMWAEQFINDSELDSAKKPNLNEPSWWRAFAAWLQSQTPEVIRSWNQHRASLVISHLRDWAKTNGVPTEHLFSTVRARSLSEPSGSAHGMTESMLRQAIIAAASELPLEQLGDFSVPIRYLIRHFRAH